jgi:hypothetical protein
MDSRNPYNNKIHVYHTIQMEKYFNELKFTRCPETKQLNSPLLTYINKHKIQAIPDNFAQQNTTLAGFFMGINPQIIHRQMVKELLINTINSTIDLNESKYDKFYETEEEKNTEGTNGSLNKQTKRKAGYDTLETDILKAYSEMDVQYMKRQPPTFDICIGSVSYTDKNDKTTSVKVIDIRCASKHAGLIKTIFSIIKLQDYIKSAHFIPRGLIQISEDPSAYRNIIMAQEAFLNNTKTFAILGLTLAAANYIPNDT